MERTFEYMRRQRGELLLCGCGILLISFATLFYLSSAFDAVTLNAYVKTIDVVIAVILLVVGTIITVLSFAKLAQKKFSELLMPLVVIAAIAIGIALASGLLNGIIAWVALAMTKNLAFAKGFVGITSALVASAALAYIFAIAGSLIATGRIDFKAITRNRFAVLLGEVALFFALEYILGVLITGIPFAILASILATAAFPILLSYSISSFETPDSATKAAENDFPTGPELEEAYREEV